MTKTEGQQSDLHYIVQKVRHLRRVAGAAGLGRVAGALDMAEAELIRLIEQDPKEGIATNVVHLRPVKGR